MDIDLAKFLLQLLEFIVVGACSVYVYIANKNRVTNQRINEMEAGLESKIDDHSERLSHLEARADGAPTHNDLSALHEKINKVGEDVKGIGGQFEGVKNLLNTIHQYLLAGRK
jgi:oligoendopeptidase F